MVDDVTNSQNLGSASRLAMQSLGIDTIAPSDWTQDERVAFLQAMASIIVNYAQDYTDATVASAQQILQHPPADLSTGSDDAADEWNTFGYTFMNDAQDVVGTPLTAVGNAVSNIITKVANTASNTASAVSNASAVAEWIIPAGVIVLFIWLIKDPERAANATKGFAGAGREAAGGVRGLFV